MGMGILTVPNFYDGDGSRVAIPDGDLPIATLIQDRTECLTVEGAAVPLLPRTPRNQKHKGVEAPLKGAWERGPGQPAATTRAACRPGRGERLGDSTIPATATKSRE